MVLGQLYLQWVSARNVAPFNKLLHQGNYGTSDLFIGPDARGLHRKYSMTPSEHIEMVTDEIDAQKQLKE